MWHLLSIFSILVSPNVAATAMDETAQSTPVACYDVHLETIMPHLEDNLRYADTEQTQCLTRAAACLVPDPGASGLERLPSGPGEIRE